MAQGFSPGRQPTAALTVTTPTLPWSPAARARHADTVDVNSSALPQDERGWIMTGVYLMTLPLTLPLKLGMAIMWAPVSWMLGARSKQTLS